MIYINNIDDVDNFYKRVKFYKKESKNKKITLKIDRSLDEKTIRELKEVEKALNIEDDFERLKYVYETLCDELDIDIKENICEFDKNGLCIAQRNGKHNSKINGCCGKCIYIGKKGCTIKSITCKTFYCNYLKSIKKVPNYKDIKLYKYFLSFPQKLIIETNFFTKEEDNLKILYKANIFTWLFLKQRKMKRF